MNCVVCHQPLDPSLTPEISHPSCSVTSFQYEGDAEDPFNAKLKQQLLEMILYAESRSPRNHQPQIGPSELGEECDRKIAYRLAGIPEINTAFDPWPSTVGTAIHAWLDKACSLWNTDRDERYMTEVTIPFDFGAVGHGDVFTEGVVIDWKTAAKDGMSKVRRSGPSAVHRVQVHTYGYGYVGMGYKVERVALVYVPRSGWIKDMVVWSEPYDESVAVAARDRMFAIANTAMNLQVLSNPHRWEQIDATPSDVCGRCPWFNGMRTNEEGASDQGCPGS